VSAAARIRILKELTPPAQLASALGGLLSSLELDELPHHRARLVVEAVQALADVDVTAARELASAELSRIRGKTGFFSALARVEFSYLPECLAGGEILTEAGQVGLGTERAYFSAHLTRDMFTAALANAPREAPGFLRRAAEQSWSTAMAALEAAAGPLVHHCGPDISDALLATTQAAWSVLNGGQLPAHLDGVAVRENLEPPWESQGLQGSGVFRECPISV
jgi:hypothetical protein